MRRVWPLLILVTACGAALTATDAPTYSRSRFGSGWIDADRDCQDTRQEVLIEESEVPVTFTDESECRVAVGRWTCPLTGIVFTDPGDMDIDHTVALRDAWGSGAWEWTDAHRKEFSNDLTGLDATSASANRSKGSRGPDAWLPLPPDLRCPYIDRWMQVHEIAGLHLTPERRSVIDYMLTACSRGDAPHVPQ